MVRITNSILRESGISRLIELEILRSLLAATTEFVGLESATVILPMEQMMHFIEVSIVRQPR